MNNNNKYNKLIKKQLPLKKKKKTQNKTKQQSVLNTFPFGRKDRK